MSVQALIDAMLDEADLIDELMDAVIEQRDSIKSGNHVALQDLMKRVQNISLRVQAKENQRASLTESLSKTLECEPHLSALALVVPEGERVLFTGAGERLGHSVFALKSEIAILSGIIEHNERFSAMLLSEWRRMDAEFTHSGGMDFRG